MKTNEKSYGLLHVCGFLLPFCFGMPLGYYWSTHPKMPADILFYFNNYIMPAAMPTMFIVGIILLGVIVIKGNVVKLLFK